MADDSDLASTPNGIPIYSNEIDEVLIFGNPATRRKFSSRLPERVRRLLWIRD